MDAKDKIYREAKQYAAFMGMDCSNVESRHQGMIDKEEVFILCVLNHIFTINGEEDPNRKINNPGITRSILLWYSKAASITGYKKASMDIALSVIKNIKKKEADA